MDRARIGQIVDYERGKKGWSIEQLAQYSNVSDKTVRKVIKGQTVQTYILGRIGEAIELDLLTDTNSNHVKSDDYYGGYLFDQVTHYQGLYESVRRSYINSEKIVSTNYKIYWSEADNRLKFSENNTYVNQDGSEVNYNQGGDIYISSYIGLVHLLTVHKGAARLITLTRLLPDQKLMKGAVLTQVDFQNMAFRPAISPICFEKISDELDEDQFLSETQFLGPDDVGYDEKNKLLIEAQEQIVKLSILNNGIV